VSSLAQTHDILLHLRSLLHNFEVLKPWSRQAGVSTPEIFSLLHLEETLLALALAKTGNSPENTHACVGRCHFVVDQEYVATLRCLLIPKRKKKNESPWGICRCGRTVIVMH
jgi:hypothetical protein